MYLGEYRDRAERLADHLPWTALVAPGVVLNKDGSFLRVLAFRGPDLESATEAELVGQWAYGMFLLWDRVTAQVQRPDDRRALLALVSA